MNKHKLKIIVCIFIAIFLVIAALFFLEVIFPTADVVDNFVGHPVIENYVISNFNFDQNDFEKTMALKHWFNDKNNYRWSMEPIVIIGRVFGGGATTTFIMKTGPCGETSDLFEIMAHSLKLKTRAAYNSGEGHQWNEILLDGNWIHIDVSGDYNFNDPKMYERDWKKKISVVYFIDSNGQMENITAPYTDTYRLKIEVADNNVPVNGITVNLYSNFYPDKNLLAFSGVTINGVFETIVGDNNYNISIVREDVLSPFWQRIDKHIEITQDTSLTLDFKDSTTTISSLYLIIIELCLILVLIFLVKRIKHEWANKKLTKVKAVKSKRN